MKKFFKIFLLTVVGILLFSMCLSVASSNEVHTANNIVEANESPPVSIDESNKTYVDSSTTIDIPPIYLICFVQPKSNPIADFFTDVFKDTAKDGIKEAIKKGWTWLKEKLHIGDHD